MSRQTPTPSVKTVSEAIDNQRIVSPLEKSLKKISGRNKGLKFGILDRQTLEICACYKDSVKLSVLALIGTFIGVVITFKRLFSINQTTFKYIL